MPTLSMLRRRCLRQLGAALLLMGVAGAVSAQEAGSVMRVPTREGVQTTVYWLPAAQGAATATVLLFPGGEGGFGAMQEGRPSSDNFLVRTASHFAAQGLNVAIFGRPNGKPMQPAERMGADHLQDVRQVVQALKARSGAPLWLVGTSRGTTSAAAAASHLQDEGIAGLVLTSSIVSPQTPGNMPSLDLAAIRMPVLLMHHAKDACKLCSPNAMPSVLERFTGAQVKKLMMVDGGNSPSGDVCHALHWHGFIGMEEEAVQQIVQWIRQPVP